MTYSQMQNFNKALTELKKALTLGRECWGSDHEDMGCTYYQLGLALNGQGDYDQGLVELRRGLEIFQKTLGRDHEAVARTLHHMG